MVSLRHSLLRTRTLILLGFLVIIFIVICALIFQKTLTSLLQLSSPQSIEDVAHIQRDIQYCDTDDSNQSLDLFLPTNATTNPTPLLLYIHGGGWDEGDKNNLIEQEYSVELARRGIAVASIDYRLSHEAKYPAQIEDVSCAAAYMAKNAKKYTIDTQHMIIMGDSAGGHLAAMESLIGKRSYDGVVMAYGVSNLWKQINEYNDRNAVRLLGEKREELANSASPQFVNMTEKPEFLLVHGESDQIVPIRESVDFAQKLKDAGVAVSYIPIANAGHGFLGTNDEHDKEAKRSIIAFIDKILKR